MQHWLTTAEVAEQMGVKSGTVRRWIATRGLTWHDIGGGGRPKIRIAQTDLDDWVKDPNKAA